MGYWNGSAWERAVTLLDDGRVGIATTSPDHVLELNQISGLSRIC